MPDRVAVVTGEQRDARTTFAGRATIAALLTAAGAALVPVIAEYLGRVAWAGAALGIKPAVAAQSRPHGSRPEVDHDPFTAPVTLPHPPLSWQVTYDAR